MPSNHPDYEIFHSLGSPLNTLSTTGNGEFLNAKTSLSYYSQSQSSFANHSIASLIHLNKRFIFDEIFDPKTALVSKEEIAATEEIYQCITNMRKEIASRTSTPGVSLNALSYNKTHNQHATSTRLSSNYSKYIKLKHLHGILYLDNIVKQLGETPLHSDIEVILGQLTGSTPTQHEMGNYRMALSEQQAGCSREDAKYRINRVDEITTLALKKAFLTQDQDEALKYTFIFGILRGYNVRSLTGACWAQEMSMRLVFAQKGWTQFKKAPEIYLDVEATLIGEYYPEEMLSNLVEKMTSDYKKSTLLDEKISEKSLFSRPIKNEITDFENYLSDIQSYQTDYLDSLSKRTISLKDTKSRTEDENIRITQQTTTPGPATTLPERVTNYISNLALSTLLPSPLVARIMTTHSPSKKLQTDEAPKKVKATKTTSLKNDERYQGFQRP